MIKVGVIGYGYWGPNIVRNFHGVEDTQVEMLCVPLASPPVPQVSMAPSGARTVTACARRARAAPVISSTVSPRERMPISSAPIWASLAPPDMIVSKASAASLSVSVLPAATLRR